MPIAVTRPVSLSFGRCELTHLARVLIDVPLARAQHRAYERALVAAGCQLHTLAPEPDLPDAVFVEDAAVALPELALIARPGARSRRAEVESVAAALAAWRPLARVEEPGTIDGGDVLTIGRRIWVGLSSRTNASGIAQLRLEAERLGYSVTALAVHGCLHLKSAVTAVNAETILFDPRWIDAAAFAGYRVVEVDPAEDYAANVLSVGGHLIYPTAFPRTAERLARFGELALVDVSEIAKAEGAVTCCSLILDTP